MAELQQTQATIEAHALAKHVRMSPQKARLDVDELYVNTCYVNEGTRWKRLRPAPMGRAFRYQKRTAHLWVGVAEHHVAAAERHAVNVAEQESNKGVRGTARR